jgi:preprotein translocase subunit YajC
MRYTYEDNKTKEDFPMPMFLTAAADGAATNPAGGTMWTSIIMLVVLGVVFYFFIIRPQKKQEKEATALRNSLSIGDEVTTIGGIIGRVINVKDDTFVLETTRDRTRIRFERAALKRIDRKFDAPEAAEEPAADEKTEDKKDA